MHGPGWARQLPSLRLLSVLPPRSTVWACSTRANSFCQDWRGDAWVRCSHHLPVPSPFQLAPLRAGTGSLEGRGGATTWFLLLGSVLGSFSTGQPNLQFLGKSEVILRNYIMMRRAPKRRESDTYSFPSPSDWSTQICNEREEGRKNAELKEKCKNPISVSGTCGLCYLPSALL